MKPIIRCSHCESDLRLGDQHCANCGQPVEWPAAGGRQGSGRSGRGRNRDTGEQARKPSTTGLSPTGKLVTGIVALVVVAAVVWSALTDSSNRPQSMPASSAAPGQAPGMGGAGMNMQAATQMAELEGRVAQNPGNHEQLLQAAHFAHDNRFFEKAISFYDRYLEHHSDDVNAMVDKGICYHELQRSEEAIAIMNQALKIQPGHLQANFNLGIINLNLGNVQKANEWFAKVVALAPNSDIGRRAQELLAPHANLPTP